LRIVLFLWNNDGRRLPCSMLFVGLGELVLVIKPPLRWCFSEFCLWSYIKCRWKLLDFALLKRNSVSFFDIEKPETAVSKWSRARMRAAKVPIVFFCSDISS
jgi:hypothetical protein